MKEENFKSGLLYEPKPEDYVLGGVTGITFQERLQDGDWSKYFPRGERQKFRQLETMACASYTANDSFETQVNWMIKEDLIDPTLLADWIDENGDFNLSDRFTAKMSGTGVNGNSLNAPAESLRVNGCPPEKMWPAGEDFDWDDYYKNPSNEAKLKGKELVDKYFVVKYEWLTATYDSLAKVKGYSSVKRDLLSQQEKQAPINIGTAVCPGWFSDDGIIKSCSLNPVHATLYGHYEELGSLINSHYKILDHYEPFVKKLSCLYIIYFGLKMVVTPKEIIKKKNMDSKLFIKTHDQKFVRNSGTGAFGRVLNGKLRVITSTDRGVLLLMDDKVRTNGINISNELWESLDKENF